MDKQSLEYIKNILGEDMYNTGAGYTAGTGYNMGDRVQLCAPNGQYFSATVTLSNNVPKLKFDDQDGYAAACRGQYASIQAGLSEIVQGLNKISKFI